MTWEKRKKYNYTKAHRKAFLKVEKELFGKNTIGGYLHDLDKLFMYRFTPFSVKSITSIHRFFSKHHMISFWKKKAYKQAVVDWECARITKPDKPLNARQTLHKFYSGHAKQIEPILDRLGI